ncbi:MAG TPA: RNA methyltransferase [Tepidisphaeraceae bacterium]|jgi:tRNA G18 (ribose-2'-O)-methylase SpoU
MITPDDSRLRPYYYTGTAKRLEPTDVFIAEGEKIVRRLWASDYVCDSVLVSDTKADRLRPDVPAGAELLVVSEATMHAVLGFKFHSGVMATGRRRAWPTASDWLATLPPPGVLLVLPEITDPLNFGAILRNAAAFGVTGVLLGEHCRDPLTRQTIRTSMGTIFRLPIARSDDLAADLNRLRQAGYESWATVLADDATPLHATSRPGRVALLMGNEGPGLSPELAAACDRRVTIEMSNGTDSLNVAAASAVFLYHLTRK